MIKDIIDLLNASDWMVEDEDIQIAKGKYKAPTTWKELKVNVKRNTITNGR
jgi:hypothetical protein